MRCSWILAATLTSGCFSAVQMQSNTLRARASFDLQCPSEQLQVTELDNSVAGVAGCGQRATYVYNNGSWVLNSPGAEQPGSGPVLTQPPPPVPPPAAPPR